MHVSFVHEIMTLSGVTLFVARKYCNYSTDKLDVLIFEPK
jgi:hypothetical protein